jgi:ATP-dependent helicase/nuclease subunit B
MVYNRTKFMTNQKNIFAIAPQADYLKTLAQFIYSQCGGDLLALSRVRIILPNHRSTLKIKEDFIEISPNKAVILPEIISLGDLDEEGAEISKAINNQLSAEIKPAISTEKKLFLLAKIIRENSGQSFGLGDISFEAALKLASSLSTLLDDVEKHELTIMDLEKILPEELSEHRKISLDFIRFIFAEYPKMLDEMGFSDRARKTNLLINGFAESLQKSPPQDAIFIAGSTGSVPATRRLMKVISRLPNGHVILPFTDFSLNSFEWDELENDGNETNNQKPIQKLLKFLEATRADIKMLNAEQDGRSATISQLMKSAALMDSWKKNKVGDIGWVKLIEAKNPIDEAKLVSAVIRHKLSQNKSVALITNNKDMAEKVRLFVKRFGMNIDDSSGATLDRTEEGALLLEAAHLISSGFRITNMLSLFKLSKISGVEELEKNVIRKNNIKYVSELKNIPNSLSAVISSVTKNIQPSESLKNLVGATYEIVNALNPSLKLDESEAWGKIELLINNFIETDSGQKIETELFANCLQVLLSGKKIWPKYIPNKNVAILSPIEARLQHFDCVILGDLTLGSWPAGKFSPWLSRNMFKSMELPFEEETIALSAHDFASHLHTAEVFVSLSEYIAGEPVIESPFVSRLKAFYKAAHGGEGIGRCDDYNSLVAELDGDDAPRKTYELPKVKPPGRSAHQKTFCHPDREADKKSVCGLCLRNSGFEEVG